MFRSATIRTVTTTIVTNGPGTLWTVNINSGSAGAILKIYNGTSASGTLVAQIDASSKSGHSYGIYCREGIFLDLSVGAADCTIGYA